MTLFSIYQYVNPRFLVIKMAGLAARQCRNNRQIGVWPAWSGCNGNVMQNKIIKLIYALFPQPEISVSRKPELGYKLRPL